MPDVFFFFSFKCAIAIISTKSKATEQWIENANERPKTNHV